MRQITNVLPISVSNYGPQLALCHLCKFYRPWVFPLQPLDPLAIQYSLVPKIQFCSVKTYITGSTYIVSTHGKNNAIYHIKQFIHYDFSNLIKCIILQIIYICLYQKNPFFFIQICPLTNFETKVRYNT
jgi:hypothetical protein